MTTEELSKALGEIDDKYIEEARCYKMKKRFPIKRTIAAAACAALVIGTFPLINHFTSTPAGTGTTDGIIDAGTTSGTEDTLPTVIKLGESGKFTIWESSRHMSDDNALVAEHNVQRKIIVQNDYFIDEELVGTEKTIIMNGKTWTGKYAESINSSYYGSDIDSYICKQNGKVVYDFAINRETGRLEWFYATQYESIETPQNPLTQEECYEVALNYLKENFEDIEEYEMEFVTDKISKNAYNFILFRKINGIRVSDYINIGVTTAGDIFTYGVTGYHSMDNVDVSAINMDKLNKLLDETIKEIYKNNFEISCEPEKISLVRLDNNTFYFTCRMAVTGKATVDSEISQDVCYFHIIME